MRYKVGLFLASLLMVQSVFAADLVVFSAAAMKAAVRQVPAQFFAATGNHVRFVFGTAGQVHDKVAAGEKFDLVIATPSVLADLAKRNLVKGESTENVGVVLLGAAVKTGAPAPAIGDDQAFKKTLLDATSIGMANPATGATSGVYLAKLMDRLGVADAIHTKVKYYSEGQTAMEAMARGEVTLGLGQISEIMPVHGVTLVGPIPEDLQLKTIYAAALASKSDAPAAAQKLLDYLLGPAMRKSLKANGFALGS